MSDTMDDQAFAGTCPTCGQAYLQAENARLEAGYREILHIQSQTEHVPQWIVDMATEKLRLPSYYSEPLANEQSPRDEARTAREAIQDRDASHLEGEC